MSKRGIRLALLAGMLLALVAGIAPVQAKRPPKPPPEPADPAIAYVVSQWKGSSLKRSLMVMDADGSNRTLLADGAMHVDWAPDGERLVYSREDGLYVINVDGTGNTRVLDLPYPSWPAWCPVEIDGEDAIAFSWADLSVPGSWPDLYLLLLDGSDPVPLTSTSALAEYEMTWSPSGTRLAYRVLDADSQYCWGICDLFEGTNEVYEHVGDLAGLFPRSPSWSKTDEDVIAWSVWNGEQPFQFDLWIMNLLDVENPVQITETSSVRETTSSFSPDGARIVFTTYETPPPRYREVYSIEVMDADGSNRAVLLSNCFATQVAWKR